MSEQKRISPLLDGFTLGAPIGDHDGVTCCPAIKENTEKKYIVKIISVPATQVQMDALLLAGAFKDPSGAMDYYKEVAEDVVKEAELLQKLSKREGFLPYDGWQIEPITRRRLGYEVYLISSYKRSLEKHLHRNPVTHLEAVNLGLDICSALSVCRDAGFLYVDLKPSNIFVSERKEYRVGDLGFLSLDALHYTTLPQKYHSAYTPPEFSDPMAPLNTTADTYALGMILYQLYNDSQLPSREDVLAGAVPAPVNADYEIAEIILKAIHLDHQQRWQDPSSMKQALVAYMQRNVINDDPITPHVPLDAIADGPVSEGEEAGSSETETPAGQEDHSAPKPEEDTDGETSISQEEVSPRDDTEPNEEDDTLLPHEMSEELSRIVAKADDLIAHELPEAVVVPEAPELPDPFAFASEDTEESDDSDIPIDPVMPDPAEGPNSSGKKKKARRFLSPERKRKVRQFLTGLLLLVTMAAVGLCVWLYYQLFYLIPVNAITLEGTSGQIIARIDTIADEAHLNAVCTDPYGKVLTAPVSGGQAVFQDLKPNQEYTITFEIDGFHKLSGTTSGTFTTKADTNIVSFQSAIGPEDGSLVLYFTVDGQEPKDWTILCSSDGQKEQAETFTGHSVTIRNLTVGKVYTFTLTTDDDLTVSGMTSIDVLATRLILAEDLTVTSSDGTDMCVSWKAPGDVIVDSWDVHVYNNKNFDVQFAVEETSALIPDADPAAGYTIEITAAGMSHPARTTVTADPIRVTGFTMEDSEDAAAEELNLTWEFEGEQPKRGWLLMYTVEGNPTPSVISCDTPSAQISPRIPGAKYRFTLQTASGTSVLNNTYQYTCPEAAVFNQFNLTGDAVTAKTLKTPEDSKWTYESIASDDFTDTFASGDQISVVLQAQSNFYQPGSKVQILYVYRDAHGNALPDLLGQERVSWPSIWAGGDLLVGELDVPTAPVSAGSYMLEIYINGMTMAKVPITIQ